MKKITRVLFVLSLITISSLFSAKKSAAQDVDVQIFYDQLSPYGTWVSDPSYGYVWVPQAEAGFTPYGTAGHWEWTDDGWLWVSDYPWGWAPFHYGRWNYDNNYGWMWVPGRTWGPAWVSWRSSPGYYGWCALGPGVGINGYASYNPPADRWVFVQDRYINSPHVTQYYMPRENVVTIYNRTTIINNRHVDNARHTTYFAGPRREDVQKATGAQIKPVVIRNNPRPGQTAVGNGEVNVYRPTLRKTAVNAPKPAPQKVAAVRDLKPIPGGHAQESLSHQPARTTAAPNKAASQPAKASPFKQPQKQGQPQRTAAPKANNTQPQKQQPQHAAPNTQPQKQAQPKQTPQQPLHNAPRANNPQQQKQSQPQAAPRQPQHNAAPHVNNAPAHNQQQPQAAPKQQAPQQPRPQPQHAQPAQQPRAQQPRPQPQSHPQPTPQARPAEQPHQEEPKQEEQRPR